MGDPAAPDRDIITWANTNGYVIFTNDLDFGAILAVTQVRSPSVIQVRTQDIFPSSIETIIIDSLRRFESELEAGALITIDLNRFRVRILPID
ncbi:hypothetical protein G3T18_20995 [Oscillatoria salina IIICB1]|nr:DUF5615 family PIN-like protein [Oscillatoria salina]MBZ8182544.1 hypothetical protein [Oscillatoria salina IIICB1]